LLADGFERDRALQGLARVAEALGPADPTHSAAERVADLAAEQLGR
jgi:hypothetical protein